jgi:beta-glucosidase
MSMSHWPKDFLWGAATAAHQVEGNNVNNWTRFELEHATELAKSARERYKDFAMWPEIKQLVTNPDNYVSGLATDHYRRYREDFDIMQSLHFNAFRFSIEWSRCEPKEGKWDAEAFAHYRVYIRELKARGITPVMTLYHWTHPRWFEEKGAFARAKNSK